MYKDSGLEKQTTRLFERNELQVIFESFSVPAMYLAQQAVLTLSLGLFLYQGFRLFGGGGGVRY